MSCRAWPENWPRHFNGGELCDMLIGPCSCGASHERREFELINGILYRYGKIVRVKCKVPVKLEELLKQRDALDCKIKRVQIHNAMACAKSFTIRAIFVNAATIEYSLTEQENVRKLKTFLSEL